MRRMKLSAIALIGVLGVTSVTGVARAGCCDDFWSCLGAVATAGVSCQVQNLIDSVTALKNMVDTTIANMSSQANNAIAQAQRSVGDAAGDLKQLKGEAAGQLKSSADQAHELANRPIVVAVLKPGVVAKTAAPANPAVANKPVTAPAGALKGVAIAAPAPPKPADAQATKDALVRGDKYIQDLLAKSVAPSNQANVLADAAMAAAARHLDAARRISLDLTLTPLNMVRDSLLDLLKHPERLFDPSAQINADIQRIATQMPAMFDRIATEVTQEALAQLNQGTGLVQQLQESASSAKAVADSMQKLQSSKLQSDLDELNGLLPKPAAVAVAPAAGMAPRPTMVALAPSVTLANKQRLNVVLLKADPAKLPIVIQQKATAGDLSQKWQAIQLKQKTAVQVEQVQVQKVDKDLGQMFVGKKGADADKKKKELLEEAKKRFANDPKTLAKVQQYIETHAPKS